MPTTAQQQPWQLAIVERLGEYTDNDAYTHAIVHIPADDNTDAVLLARADGDAEAAVHAEDYASRVDGGEVKIVPFDLLYQQYVDIKDPAPASDSAPTVERAKEEAAAETDPFEAADDPAETDDPAVEGGALFDKTDYDDPRLALDRVDERDIDVIRLSFSGNVKLDRKNPEDVALIRNLRLGQDLTLRVEAAVAGKGTGFTTGKEGDLDAVVFTGGLKVHSIYALTPEEL